MEYTAAQSRAIGWNGGNLLVSAAAGSGKTFTLTERIIRLIKEGVSLKNMLIVTFTQASAADLKNKIFRAIRTEAMNGAGLGTSASEAAAMVTSADISTISSFLYRNLKPYFPVLGIPQDSRIADQKTVDLLKKEVMGKLVSELYAEGVPGVMTKEEFADFAEVFADSKNDVRIDAEILGISDRLEQNGLPAEYAERSAEQAEAFAESANIMDTVYGRYIIRELSGFADDLSAIIRALREEINGSETLTHNLGETLESISGWLGETKALLGAPSVSYGDLKDHFLGFSAGPRLGTRKYGSEAEKETSDLFKKMRESMKYTVGKYAEKYFCFDEETEKRNASRTSEVLRRLASVISEFIGRFGSTMRDMSLISFNDLEKLSLRLLYGDDGEITDIAREISRNYRYVFIDEYQDTNEQQDRIFSAISCESERFMVGDIKQSIYAFRGAKPGLFREYRDRWPLVPDDGDSGEGDAEGHSLFMSENFRCDRSVIDFANRVSDTVFPYGNISYGSGDRLVFAKREEELGGRGPSEVYLFPPPRSDEKKKLAESGFCEEEFVADMIEEMTTVPDRSGRTVAPGDIAILVRTNKYADKFAAHLARRNIPFRTKRGMVLSDYASVRLLVCLLNLIDNSLRDVYAAGALRSPVFGFDIRDLAELRKEGKNHLFSAVREKAASDDRGTLAEKCRYAVRWLERQKAVANGMTADKYLDFLIADTNIQSMDGIRGVPDENEAINKFKKAAIDLREGYAIVTGNTGVSSLVNQIPDFIDDKDEEHGAEMKTNEVTIQTIHTSKGLEYPVVFLSKTGASLLSASNSDPVIEFDPDLGIGISLPDSFGFFRCSTLIRNVVRSAREGESVRESMRNLYVAMTRAREKLIVTGEKTSDMDGSWAADGIRQYLMTKPSYLRWILASLEKGDCSGFCRVSDVTFHEAAEDVVGPDAEDKPSDPENPGGGLSGKILENMGFEYGFGHLRGIPSKITVSKLRPGILDGDDVKVTLTIGRAKEGAPEGGSPLPPVPERPKFMSASADAVRPVDRGTATHQFLQFADFGLLREKGAEAEKKRLVDERYISAESASIVDLEQIGVFASGSLLDRILRSDMVKREFRFVDSLPASMFTSDTELAGKLDAEGSRLTVQGAVDCIFRDPDTGKLVLIDYKTDSFSRTDDRGYVEKVLVGRHKLQLTYYAVICSRIFGEPVDDVFVYSTHLGECVRIPV